MTVNEFFTSLEGGSTWSAGVAFKRSKALPLERWEIFRTEDDLKSYAAGTYAAAGAVAYPGQVCKVVDKETGAVTLYYMNFKNEVLTPTLLVDKDGILQTTLDKITGTASVNVTNDAEGNKVISLPGAANAVQGQVFTALGNGTFGFMDATGGGTEGGTGLKFYDYNYAADFTASIPFSTHAINSENIIVHIALLKTGTSAWWDAENANATVKTTIAADKTVNVTVSGATPTQFSKVRILLIGGAVQSEDQVARNAGIASGAIVDGDLVLTKVDGTQITIDMDALTPTSDNLANVIEGGNGVDITNANGKLSIAVKGYDNLLNDVTAGNAIEVTGTGHARQIAVKASTEDGNIAEVKADGIYVPTPIAATVTGVKENDKVLKLTGTTLETEVTLDYVKADKKIYLKGLNGTQISEIEVDDFIKDGMLQSVVINTRADGEKELVFTWNTDSTLTPSTTSIALKDLAAVYTGGNGISVAWDSDKDAYVMSIVKGVNTDSKYIVLSEGKIDLDFSTLVADKSLATTTNVEEAKNAAIKHTDDELKKYTPTETLEANYATKAYADQAEKDAVDAAKGYTDEQLKGYTNTASLEENFATKTYADTAATNEGSRLENWFDGKLTSDYLTKEDIALLYVNGTQFSEAIGGVQNQIDKLDDTYATDTEVTNAITTAKTEIGTELGKKQDKVVMHNDIVIVSESWVADGDHFKYEIGATDYSAECTVDLIPHVGGYNTILAAEIWPTVEYENQAITLYANKQPAADFRVDIREIPLN